ncbi:hypothetical protein ElyMa_004998200 [Elysia marginata]|uniref:Uncharacterized protein n=1 Tax=Elysia marginata TaxID=1093978 RepID=A0AAV4J5M2_9GAST|nr:hypothetical protein ElyMa_004998200 [Elysia marginata]
MSETRSVENYGGSSSKLWKRGKEDAEDTSDGSSHAQKIEDVVDWREVVKRYLAMRGSKDVESEDTSGSVDRMDALDDLRVLGGDKGAMAMS